ncbi:hypothetical protein THF1C08_10233 [Vibrio jasicida]|uniref:Uncharacterized protein n=1 Tax=Vibrio jasicida TaxID=766224 RepID=A0AAU9QD61_9VIBR|nr:hypothetical protein THF1C08_10233 [Vibrio jasicida]CAH1564056.1 hypothetical protein THF1A12_10233 [Vibrio jasicida]
MCLEEARLENRDLRGRNEKRWIVLASFSTAAKEGGAGLLNNRIYTELR